MATATALIVRPSAVPLVNIPPEESFTTVQAAKICNRHRNTVNVWCKSGRLRSTSDAISGVRRIARNDLIHFLKNAGFKVEVAPMPPLPPALDWSTVDAASKSEQRGVAAPTVVINDAAQIPLAKFFEKEYWPRKTRGRSAGNRKLYLLAFTNLGKFLGRIPTLGDLDDDVIVQWIHWTVDRKRSAPTVNRELSGVKAVWNFAAKRRFVAHFPTVELLHEPRRTPQAWTAPQVMALFAAAGRMQGTVGDFEASVWWSALLQVVWWTAERIGAVMQLKWSDIDLPAGVLVFRAETRKGGTSDMRHTLPPEAVALLSQLKHEPDDLVFQFPKAPTNLFGNFGYILRAAGLPSGRRDKFHRLRRTVASFITAAGGNASLALGHSSQEITQRNYLDPIICGVRGPSELLFSPTSAAEKAVAK